MCHLYKVQEQDKVWVVMVVGIRNMTDYVDESFTKYEHRGSF